MATATEPSEREPSLSTSRPDLFGCLDHRAWLEQWFDWKKQENPRYSYRLFSRLVGQKSPSYLRDVISGRKNLLPSHLPAVSAALELDEEEARFLELLVAFDQARDPTLRDEAWDRIAATRRFQQARRLEGEGYKYVARWFTPAIRELVRRADFQDDPAWIARALQPAITEGQAADALDVLLRIGLLERDPAGRLVQADGDVVTPREVIGRAVHRYHRDVLRLASESIDRFEPEERHLVGVTVSVPSKLVPEMKRELGEFAARLNDLAESSGGAADRVVHIELCLFPLDRQEMPEDAPHGSKFVGGET